MQVARTINSPGSNSVASLLCLVACPLVKVLVSVAPVALAPWPAPVHEEAPEGPAAGVLAAEQSTALSVLHWWKQASKTE